MRGGGRSIILALAALLAGCSSSDEVEVPPASTDEQRAVAEAKAMIPANELPPATPTKTTAGNPGPMESAKP